MSIPIPVEISATNRVVQITEAHSVGDAGWSESWYIYVVGGTNPLQAAVVRHQDVIDLRRAQIPVAHVQEAMRGSDVLISGDSILIFPPLLGLGQGAVIDVPANPCLGYFMTTNDLSNTINETRIFRGWGLDSLAWLPGSPRTTVPPARPLGFLQSLAQEIVQTKINAGSSTTYVLKSFRRPDGSIGAPTIKKPLTVNAGANRLLTFTGAGEIPVGWEVGSRIHVRSPRRACVRGVSGVHLITGLTSTDGVLVITTSTVYQCDPATLTGVSAEAFLHITAWYAITGAVPGGAGKRDTGRPFFLTRGRSPARR